MNRWIQLQERFNENVYDDDELYNQVFANAQSNLRDPDPLQ